MTTNHNPRSALLDSNQHRKFDRLLLTAFEAHKTGGNSAEILTSRIMQVVAALDKGNMGEVESWLNDPDRLMAAGLPHGE
jgi:hypothetical protein